MEREWASCALGDLISVKHGWAFKGAEMSEELSEGPIVVAIGNYDYSGGFRFASTRIKRYAGEYPAEYVLQPGDMLLAMTCQTSGGEILGIPAIIPDDENMYLHNQRLGKVVVERPERVSSDYLYWLFLTPNFNRHLYACATGTKILHTSPSKICDYCVRIPDVEEQSRISRVLWSIQGKIELNRQMNATLEAMAQALFKSWFVDFDPVIDNALAAGNPIPEPLQKRAAARQALGEQRKPLPPEIQRQFPSRFVFTEELGWIPEGWEVGRVSDFAVLKTESVKPADEPEKCWTHFSIPAFDEGGEPVMELGAKIKSGKYRVPRTCVLASKLNPQFQRVWLPEVEDPELSVCSTEFMPFVPKAAEELPYLYAFLCSEVAQEAIASRVTGSTGSRQRVKPKEVAAMPFLNAPAGLRREFSGRIGPMLAKQAENRRNMSVLAQLRDILLPKLLSGELRVSEAEQQVAEVV